MTRLNSFCIQFQKNFVLLYADRHTDKNTRIGAKYLKITKADKNGIRYLNYRVIVCQI